MAYFRSLNSQLEKLESLLKKEDRWLILINADPDALGSALALKYMFRKKVKNVEIARINAISRPDNLAMIRMLRIPVCLYNEEMLQNFDRFALVDSQPHHSPLFAKINFSVLIDHHPLPLLCKDANKENSTEKKTCDAKQNKKCDKEGTEILHEVPKEKLIKQPCIDKSEVPSNAETALPKLIDIRPDYGATCTMLTEYFYTAGIKPGKYLATALQYGIRTDTGVFGRQCTETDLRAYHYLSRFADQNLLLRIIRSEYLPEWLPYFSRAFESFRPCGLGHFTYLSHVDSPDILVVIADFFLKVHGLKYIVVAGTYNKHAICIFRGSNINLGLLAQKAFLKYGSAGGHKVMARAEIPLANLKKAKEKLPFNLKKKILTPEDDKLLENFLLERLKEFGSKKHLKKGVLEKDIQKS